MLSSTNFIIFLARLRLVVWQNNGIFDII